MPRFGSRSTSHLSEAHPKLQDLFNEVIKYIDCSVLEGFRSEEEQNKLFHARKSKLQWPESKHNAMPSMAVDVVPYPIDWNDRDRFIYFGGFVLATAKQMGIDIRWGFGS